MTDKEAKAFTVKVLAFEFSTLKQEVFKRAGNPDFISRDLIFDTIKAMTLDEVQVLIDKEKLDFAAYIATIK